jgi:DNA polymerase III epsilon subunit-like protein
MRYSTDIVVLDLEATSPEEGANEIERSNIIDLGAVRLDRRSLAIRGSFSELVRPRDYPVQPFITELTGITPEMVARRESFDQVADRFIAWCGPRNRFVLAAFGAYYDVPLLRKEFRAFGLDFRKHFVGGAIDVRGLAVAWLAERNHGTTGVTVQRTLEKMGLDLGLRYHRALDDAKATAAILQFFHLGRLVPDDPAPKPGEPQAVASPVAPGGGQSGGKLSSGRQSSGNVRSGSEAPGGVRPGRETPGGEAPGSRRTGSKRAREAAPATPRRTGARPRRART